MVGVNILSPFLLEGGRGVENKSRVLKIADCRVRTDASGYKNLTKTRRENNISTPLFSMPNKALEGADSSLQLSWMTHSQRLLRIDASSLALSQQ